MQENGIHQIFQSVADSLSDRQFEDLIGTHEQITAQLEEMGQGECSS